MKLIGPFLADASEFKANILTRITVGLGATEVDWKEFRTNSLFSHFEFAGEEEQMWFTRASEFHKFQLKDEFLISFNVLEDQSGNNGNMQVITLYQKPKSLDEVAEPLCEIQYINHKTLGLFRKITLPSREFDDTNAFDSFATCCKNFLAGIVLFVSPKPPQ